MIWRIFKLAETTLSLPFPFVLRPTALSLCIFLVKTPELQKGIFSTALLNAVATELAGFCAIEHRGACAGARTRFYSLPYTLG